MVDRKRYNMSLPIETAKKIEEQAASKGLKPTTYLTQLIKEALDIKTRSVGNPNFKKGE